MTDRLKILHGDNRLILPTLEANSIDALVTDSPYGLEFMGKNWDRLDRPSDINGFRRSGNAADAGRENVFGRLSRTAPEYKLGGAGVEHNAKSAGGFGQDSPTHKNAFAAARIRYGKSVANIQEWHRLWAIEVLRVLKPGAHALVFGGTRTHHRLMCGLEDAGFEIRDCVMWVYGSGYPKSLNVGRSIDMSLCERSGRHYMSTLPPEPKRRTDDHVCAETEQGCAHDDQGTALKPAWEPIILCRKPLERGLTVAQNVLKWGTGVLNIDGCRIPTEFDANLNDGHISSKSDGWDRPWKHNNEAINAARLRGLERVAKAEDLGRWPANLILDGSDEVGSLFPNTKSGKPAGIKAGGKLNCYSEYAGGIPVTGFGDSGSAARFFYTPKPSNKGRGDKTEPAAPLFGAEEEEFRNTHPTVKPVALMKYLIKLVTKPGQTVLDCFAGSGSTGVAALELGRNIILIESDPDYIPLIEKRCKV